MRIKAPRALPDVRHLLDTHILLWALADDPALKPAWREALGFHVEDMREDGEALPAPRSVTAILADPDLAERQDVHATKMLRLKVGCLARGP